MFTINIQIFIFIVFSTSIHHVVSELHVKFICKDRKVKVTSPDGDTYLLAGWTDTILDLKSTLLPYMQVQLRCDYVNTIRLLWNDLNDVNQMSLRFFEGSNETEPSELTTCKMLKEDDCICKSKTLSGTVSIRLTSFNGSYFELQQYNKTEIYSEIKMHQDYIFIQEDLYDRRKEFLDELHKKNNLSYVYNAAKSYKDIGIGVPLDTQHRNCALNFSSAEPPHENRIFSVATRVGATVLGGSVIGSMLQRDRQAPPEPTQIKEMNFVVLAVGSLMVVCVIGFFTWFMQKRRPRGDDNDLC